LDEIQEFLTGVRPAPEIDRILATVLFTDIVGSTELAARLGDSRWSELLVEHHAAVREQLEHFRGRKIDTAGDGFMCGLAKAGEVLTSGTVRDLVAGSGIRFEDRGIQQLQGCTRGVAALSGGPVAAWLTGRPSKD
jgi:class 3 adenylate cyclase